MGVGELAAYPWLRAALAAFAEEVRGRGPVLDVGCGPGHVTAHLAGLGVDVQGVDLSPRMVEQARRLHPRLRFDVASATDLAIDDASFAAAVAPGGRVLIGTHVGDGDLARTEGYGGVPVTWTTHLWQPDQLIALLADAGLHLVSELRLPGLFGHPQVALTARRPD